MRLAPPWGAAMSRSFFRFKGSASQWHLENLFWIRCHKHVRAAASRQVLLSSSPASMKQTGSTFFTSSPELKNKQAVTSLWSSEPPHPRRESAHMQDCHHRGRPGQILVLGETFLWKSKRQLLSVCLQQGGGVRMMMFVLHEMKSHIWIWLQNEGGGVKGEQMVFCHLRGRAEWRQTEGTSVFWLLAGVTMDTPSSSRAATNPPILILFLLNSISSPNPLFFLIVSLCSVFHHEGKMKAAPTQPAASPLPLCHVAVATRGDVSYAPPSSICRKQAENNKAETNMNQSPSRALCVMEMSFLISKKCTCTRRRAGKNQIPLLPNLKLWSFNFFYASSDSLDQWEVSITWTPGCWLKHHACEDTVLRLLLCVCVCVFTVSALPLVWIFCSYTFVHSLFLYNHILLI